MENDMFVSYTGVDQKLPLANFSDVDLNDDLLNPYSDMNLGISSGQTSFANSNVYDNILGKLSTPNKPSLESTGQQTTTIPSGDRRNYVKRWLMQNEGLTNEQAAALTGVWWAESRLDPSIHEIGKEKNPYAGKGIAQWTGKQRQKHAEDIYRQIFGKSKSIKEMTLDEQLKVATTEFKERRTWQQFISSQDLKTATDIVWRGYENGGNSLASHDLMKKTYGNAYSKQWSDRFRYASEISKI